MPSRVLLAKTAFFALSAICCVELVCPNSADSRLLRPQQKQDAKMIYAGQAMNDGSTYQENREENSENRQERWDNASPNQKAATYNVAKSKRTKKENNQAQAEAALSQRAATRQGSARRR